MSRDAELAALVFELAGWRCPDGAGCRWRAEKVKETAFRLDGVRLPTTGSAEPPVCVEVQFQPDAAVYGRWLAGFFLYLYRCKIGRPWRLDAGSDGRLG